MKAQKAARKKREREKARKEIERRIERNEQTAAHLITRFKSLAQADPAILAILAPRMSTALSIWAACSEELETSKVRR